MLSRRMAASVSFPLLIEGSWGLDPPKNLSTRLQVYFQSQKRSGGGECEVCQEAGSPPRFLVYFSQEDVQQRVLQREDHKLVWSQKGTFNLTVKMPTAPDKGHVFQGEVPKRESKTKVHVREPELDTKPSLNRRSEEMEDIRAEHESISSLVALENLKENVTELMLILLVENTSGLSSDDFEVEIIRDFDVAVVTFQKHIDVMKFVADCAKNQTTRQLQLFPRLLEVTKTIRVENLPPDVDDYDLNCLFKNPRNGGGRVARVECFPEENSALIEFFDRKVVDTIMTKKLELNKMPLSVFPYYSSLGTALYGKEKPLIKLPAPFRESLDLPLWKFLHKNNHLIQEINDEVRRCHCELTWSELNGEVTIRPAPSLLRQGRQRIKSWQKNASTAFASIRSKYKVSSFKVDPIVWDTVKSDLQDNRVLIEFDTLLEIVTLVGKSEDVQKIEPQLTELIESTTQRIKREQQSLKEKVSLSPGRFSLLCHSGALERFRSEDPEVEIVYHKASRQMGIRGLPADVYKVKCEVQEKVHAMAQKHVQVPPEVFQFLQQVDAAEFSKSLFIAQKILAIYELKDPSVLLTSCSPEVLLEAEKQMTSALNYQRIDVENRHVLNGKKWKGLTRSLLNKHNSSSMTVIINELTSDVNSEVIVAGCVREVKEIYHLLFDFLDKHMVIERMIEVKPSLVNDFLRKEKKPLWQKIKKTNLQVVFNPENKQNGISLTGPRIEVLNGMTLIKKARDSLCVKSIHIDQPGVRQLFQERGAFYRSEVKRLFGCFIEVQENKEKAGEGTDGKKCLCRVDLAPGVSLIVQQGDLTGFPVEVVVNAANEELQHIGGLAAALLEAAGPELQADCDQIVKRNGKVPPGHATISKPGKLPYRCVIHAVGPHWKRNEAQRCVSRLKRAVEESLCLAEKHKCQSIAIPAISSGVFGFPLPECVETIVSAVKGHFQHKSDGCTLKEIYLVDTAEKTVEAFASAVKTLFKDARPDAASLPRLPAASQPDLREDHGNGQVLLSSEGLRLLLVKGEVQSAAVDVIVNSVPSSLSLNRGPLSQALLGKAGPKLQKELNAAGQGVAVDVGTVLLTSGCNLQCQHVLHVVAPGWKNNSTSAHKIMEDLIRKCLEITESHSLKSIAFPAIGTGNLGFPKPVFAKLIISEVFKFSSNNQATTLQEVHFLLHPQDLGNIQAFSEEFFHRTNGNVTGDKIPQAEDTQGFHGTVSSPNPQVHKMKIGPITFQVATGDITKEEADVIVNSTSNTFDFTAGVSKAVLEGAGQNVKMECSYQAKQGNRDYIITGGGLLKCKNIIHVVGGNDVKTSVTHILQESEKRYYSSICLPAIGTGSANQDPDKVAGAIIDAIEGFVQKGSIQSVKKVKVVLFVPQLLDVFYTNMKKRERFQPSPQQSVMSYIAPFLAPFFFYYLVLLAIVFPFLAFLAPFTLLFLIFLAISLFYLIFLGSSQQSPKENNQNSPKENNQSSPKENNPSVLKKKTESVIFQVCGENVKCVENALSWIQDLVEKEQCCFTSKDECIKDFDEKEVQKLNELQKKLNITISLDHKKPLIEVSGISRDVTEARNEIEEMIQRVRLAKEQESRADYTSEFIEWRYNNNHTFHSFDKITILQLEDARRTKRRTIDVKINHQTYTVDLKTYTATNAKGHNLPVQRLKKSEVEIPAYWTDMRQQSICVVGLYPGNPDYNSVASKFYQTCANFRIEKIERIQNPDLWNSYQTKKKTMDAKNNHVINERLLFHGTDAHSMPHVNRNGFNRSYAGKNAVLYGKGTYFAVNASYSANDTYSKPDANGKKYMYYVRVLTGLSAPGNQSLIVPPPKDPRNPTDLYDTVTDNVSNPTLFVVFYDYQAYPEYLITFSK
ncbi:protein mono-ADP-ribosyltransferase PARP14 isoform X2 [Talpa occidentalis]|uniref:protein mono-ADP-ribosyltransferase PARP14 isoform X2 n=1 Tax=Talpa occidentalis TaxID=50954 RepID=UPI0023F89F63|nr:protein mono-ADP-ribosyltransferase PARP14 isoform X2 [Talpa occidentalis]